MRIDKGGFYLYWVDQNNEMDMLDIATIRDVRIGQYARKPKVTDYFSNKYQTLVICGYFLLGHQTAAYS